MGLEAATFINQLVATNPVGATDPKSQGDDHLRLIKSTLQATFPSITGAVTKTHAEINALVQPSDAITWTGLHAWSNAAPLWRVDETDAAANERNWLTRSVAGDWFLSTATDAAPTTPVNNAIAITRSGTTIDAITFAGAITGVSLTLTAAAAGVAYPLLSSSGTPGFALNETDGAADNKFWRFIASGEALFFGVVNDAGNTATDWLTVQRTGTAIDSILLSSPLLQAQGIHNGTAPTGTNNYIASGTYTPTLFNGANVDASTSAVCQWMRVGNVVTVSGTIAVDPTAASTSTQVGVSLPIASALASVTQCSGAGAFGPTTAIAAVQIGSDAPNDRAQLTWVTPAGVTTSQQLSFAFTYLVL